LGERTKFQTTLLLLFLLTLPLINPWVRGDGVGYYAYIRSLLIDGDLRFENEFLAGNSTFVLPKLDEQGRLRPDLFTRTGYVDNHFTVGPGILWAPFLAAVHLGVKGLNAAGVRVRADGYSGPYVWTMALATALYGFLGIFLSFSVAKEYFAERWAFLAALGIWFASSLPVYMYFNPSWSHAHSAFAVALFLWYWHRTRGPRSPLQWTLLGLLAGLMINVYYPNAILMLVPLLESLGGYWQRWRNASDRWAAVGRLFAGNVMFSVAGIVGLLPTMLTRQVLYGSAFSSGYGSLSEWNWNSPQLWNVLFSSNHGVFSWTPILVLGFAGLLLLWRHDRELSACLLAAFVAFYYLIASYMTWHGIASFGNRFFVSLTPLFVIGLASFFAAAERWFPKRAAAFAGGLVVLFIAWNLGLIFQWGTQMIPARGPVSWKEVAHNQYAVVPMRVWGSLRGYLLQRRTMMDQIERKDVEKLHPEQAGPK
jgi:hypothetical protein